MDDEDAFLRTIKESPEDQAPKLIYADWLDENGHAERAEFIRTELSQLAIPNTKQGLFQRKAVRDRLRVLRQTIDPKWAATFDDFQSVRKKWDP